nr:hypothetical protein [Candidatus Freyrarchaeum guaymaensis]
MIVVLTSDAVEAFNLELAGKFLATIGLDGRPNVVPVISIRAFDEETLVFGEFMMVKTKRNLVDGCAVCTCVITERLDNYVVRGVFEGFEKRGKYYDFISEIPLFRYNAYTGARSAGVIRVEEVWQVKRAKSRINILADTLAVMSVSGGGSGGVIPPNVAEKFNRINAVKVVAKVEGDKPLIIPALSLRAMSQSRLGFGIRSMEAERLNEGDVVATAVLTMDAIAYQVKGKYIGMKRGLLGKIGVIEAEETYTLTPPRPGEKITSIRKS